MNLIAFSLSMFELQPTQLAKHNYEGKQKTFSEVFVRYELALRYHFLLICCSLPVVVARVYFRIFRGTRSLLFVLQNQFALKT